MRLNTRNLILFVFKTVNFSLLILSLQCNFVRVESSIYGVWIVNIDPHDDVITTYPLPTGPTTFVDGPTRIQFKKSSKKQEQEKKKVQKVSTRQKKCRNQVALWNMLLKKPIHSNLNVKHFCKVDIPPRALQLPETSSYQTFTSPLIEWLWPLGYQTFSQVTKYWPEWSNVYYWSIDT